MNLTSKAAMAAWAVGALLCECGPVRVAQAQSSVSPTVQELRRHMLDESVNSLTFHSMDQLFYTREVTRSGPVWELPRRDAQPNFTYVSGGAVRSPALSLWNEPQPTLW